MILRHTLDWEPDSAGSIMTKPRDGRSSNRDPIPSQTVPGARLASGLMSTDRSFPGIKRPRRYFNDSPHLALKLRIYGAIPSLHHMPSWSVTRLYHCTIDCVSYLASRRPPLTNGKEARNGHACCRVATELGKHQHLSQHVSRARSEREIL
jgi:hypothetical protein